MGDAVGAEAAQHDGFGSQADLLALAQHASLCIHVEVVQLAIAQRAQQVGHLLEHCTTTTDPLDFLIWVESTR